MMHGREKSDPVVVAKKPTNKAEQSAAEPVEPRTGTKGNAGQQSTRRAQDRESVSQALSRVRMVAKQGKKEKFTTLFHHLDAAMLRTAFFALKRDAAPGVDGETWEVYAADLDPRIEDLHSRLHRGAYRAQPARRRFIPKPDGSQRPLAVTALEDKIIERATAAGGRDLRGRVPRVLVWVPTKAQSTRCVGCANGRHRRHEGELHFRRRHPELFQ
jgi:RNA-directed DNA polymerase